MRVGVEQIEDVVRLVPAVHEVFELLGVGFVQERREIGRAAWSSGSRTAFGSACSGCTSR